MDAEGYRRWMQRGTEDGWEGVQKMDGKGYRRWMGRGAEDGCRGLQKMDAEGYRRWVQKMDAEGYRTCQHTVTCFLVLTCVYALAHTCQT